MDSIKDLILTENSAGLFLETYNNYARDHITLSSIEQYYDKHLTFGHVLHNLTRLANMEVHAVTDDTYITKANKTRVWEYVVDLLKAEGKTLGIYHAEEHLDKWIDNSRITVAYIIAFAQDEHNHIVSEMEKTHKREEEEKKRAELTRIAKMRENEEMIKRNIYEAEHPTDSEARRRLFASKFDFLFESKK